MPSRTATQDLINRALVPILAAMTGGIGSLWYVDSGASLGGTSGDAYGRTLASAFTTLSAAVSAATANNGDVILIAPGHAESITAAAGIVISKAGLTIVGAGNESNRPTFTFSTLTTSDIDVTAANVTIRNLRFVSAIDSLAVMLDVDEGGFTIEDCEFHGPATFECLNFINLATTKDNFQIRRCRFLQDADPAGTDGAAATGAIYCVDSERIVVEGCEFSGFFETACLHNKTTALKYLTWLNNTVSQQLSTGRRVLLVAGTTGVTMGPDSDFVPGLGYRVTKTEDVNTATSDNLFDSLGKVLITAWNLEVTNALGAAVTDYQITLTTLNGVLLAAGNIASAAIGFQRTMNFDAGDTSLSTSTGAVSVTGVGDTNGKFGQTVIGRAGLVADVIKSVRTAGDSGDAILHTVYYIPLEVGAYLQTAA